MTTDWREKYRKQSGDFAPAWKPDPGDSCEGVLTGTAEVRGQYGAYTCYTIACTEEGQFTGQRLAIHANTAILREELEGVEEGDLIAVTYEGKRANKNSDGTHKVHRVAVMPAADVAEHFPDLAGEPPAASDEEEPF